MTGPRRRRSARYQSDSSDTCGIYATVTEPSDSGDRTASRRNRGARRPGDRVVQIDTTSAAPAAITNRRRAISVDTIGPVLLVVSVVARLAWTYLAPNGANFVDLHVYVGGSAMLDHPGSLYRYVYADQTPDFPLPFTYPPFAAVVFYPLHFLPFGLVAFCWTVGTMAALYGVRPDQPATAGCRGRRGSPAGDALDRDRDLARTAAQHVRLRADQRRAGAGHPGRGIQHALVAVRLAVGDGRGGEADARDRRAVFRRRPSVGRRRCSPGSSSSATIAVSALVVGDQTRYYFTDLIFKTDRVGPICTIFNQSWRGGICRILRPRLGLQPRGADRNRCHRNTLPCSPGGRWRRSTRLGCWWSSCSGCCSPRFPGRITGCGWCR